MASKGTPFTAEERQQVRDLHAQGLSLREIARRLERSTRTVSKAAVDMGLAFDSRPTASATRAKQQDNRAARAQIIAWQYRRCLRLAERLDADTFQTVGNSQEGPVSVALDFVPAQDELHLSRAIGQYAKTAADLEKLDVGQDVASDRSMLGDLLAKLRGLNSAG